MKKKAKRKYVKSGKFSKTICPIPPPLPKPEPVVINAPVLVKPKAVPDGIQMIMRLNFISIAQKGMVIHTDGDGFWSYKLPDGKGLYDETLPVWSTPATAIPEWATHVAFFPKPQESDISMTRPAGNTQRWTATQER